MIVPNEVSSFSVRSQVISSSIILFNDDGYSIFKYIVNRKFLFMLYLFCNLQIFDGRRIEVLNDVSVYSVWYSTEDIPQIFFGPVGRGWLFNLHIHDSFLCSTRDLLLATSSSSTTTLGRESSVSLKINNISESLRDILLEYSSPSSMFSPLFNLWMFCNVHHSI